MYLVTRDMVFFITKFLSLKSHLKSVDFHSICAEKNTINKSFRIKRSQ